jgi:hypothetical protein
MFERVPRWVNEAYNTAILRPKDTPDEPKHHECHEPIASPDVNTHPPLGGEKPSHDANYDKAHQEPME